MDKYLDHPFVEAPFWDMSNKLKYLGLSKGEFIKTKLTVKMLLLTLDELSDDENECPRHLQWKRRTI